MTLGPNFKVQHMKTLKKLTILHSNDLHGDFLEEQKEELNIGGVSMLSGYVSKVREQEENVIYVIAGDMFRGSVIDSEFKGISTIEIMNMLAPDVVTIGNHEIDYGVAHLLFIEKCAQFPIINANLYIKTNGTRLFTPFEIIEMDDMKILFIGIITEEILEQAKVDGLVGSFIDTGEAADEIGKICNTYNAIDIDFTVLVTHIGIEEDIKLAKLLDPEWGVDLIIGGHSHTFMDEPIIENNIVIAQAGAGTDHIGRFDIVVDTDDNCIDSYTWDFVPINNITSQRDFQLEEVINKYKDITDRKYQRIITRLHKRLTHPQRNTETSLGSFFSDIFKDALGIDVMFLGSGSIRKESFGPIVEYKDLMEIFPYNDAIHMVKVKGSQLKEMVRFMLRDEAFLGTTEYYQLSDDVSFIYSKSEKKILEAKYEDQDIDDERLFTVGLQHFHFLNIDSFFNLDPKEVEKNQKPRILATASQDILVEFLSGKHKIEYDFDKRIRIIE